MSAKYNRHDFNIIQKAIDFLDTADRDVTLSGVAHGLEISPDKLMVTLKNWTGAVSDDFPQYLSLGFSHSIPLTTDVSVSDFAGPNIHVTDAHDAALDKIFYNDIDTPFGPALVLATQHGICGLGFCAEVGMDETKHDFTARWPKAKFIQSVENLAQYESSLFDGAHAAPKHLIGSPFYVKVWKALLDIPMGHASTYSGVALKAGNARAVRAVGTAIGKNPISWLIPCHRALRKDGSLGGYHWGLSIKRAMLAYEAFKAHT
jgi:AraC family transcriptional regulator of adaptative response/methylated-DNA-[protein]-cysteine methyltransferase